MELLGPIFFLRDSAPANIWTGIVLCLVLVPAMVLGFMKPVRIWKVAVGITAAVLWLLAGVIGYGISA